MDSPKEPLQMRNRGVTDVDQSSVINPGHPRSMVQLVVAAVVFNVTFFPVWQNLIKAWSSSEDYSHGFLVVPLVAWMIWRKRQELACWNGAGNWWGLVWLAGSLALYLIAQMGEIATLASLSLVAAALSSVLFLYGSQILRAVAIPLCFLLFAVPVPAQILASVTIPLQLFVTKVTALLASWAGIPLYHEGNIIHLPQQTFHIVHACSGLRSISAILALAAMIGYFTLRRWRWRALLFALGVPIAVAVNILRVFAMVAASYFLSLDLTQGILHTLLGMAVFAASMILLLFFGKGFSLWER
ncbi:MAG: exosortase [Deltaproteobacteria bacterium]|nr:exosortase [Deltaproteobacteria bacterium]